MALDLVNRHGERLDHTLHAAGDTKDLVVIGHGVTGNKDRDWAVTLAEALCDAGVSALRLSFSGNGASEGDFRDSTITKEVDDLRSVLDAFADRRITYAGHSMGGAVGVLAASRDERIRFLVSLAGMVHTADFAQRKFGDVVPGVGHMWDKPECPLSQRFMDDMRAIGSVVDLGATITVPWLLVHGTADEVVPLSDSTDILARAGSNAELVELDGANHVFSGEAAERMAAWVVEWMTPKGSDP